MNVIDNYPKWVQLVEAVYQKLDLNFSRVKTSHLKSVFASHQDLDDTETIRQLEIISLLDYFKGGFTYYDNFIIAWDRLCAELELGEEITLKEIQFIYDYNIVLYSGKAWIENNLYNKEARRSGKRQQAFDELAEKCSPVFDLIIPLIDKYHLIPLFDHSPSYYENLKQKEGYTFVKSKDFTDEMPF